MWTIDQKTSGNMKDDGHSDIQREVLPTPQFPSALTSSPAHCIGFMAHKFTVSVQCNFVN